MSQLKIKDGNSWINIPAGGIGVPSGGNTGDVLVKSSSTDYATEWQMPFIIEMGAVTDGYYERYSNGRTKAIINYTKDTTTPALWYNGMYYIDWSITIPSGLFGAAPNMAAGMVIGDQWWVAAVNPTSATSAVVRLCRPSPTAYPILCTLVLWGDSPT